MLALRGVAIVHPNILRNFRPAKHRDEMLTSAGANLPNSGARSTSNEPDIRKKLSALRQSSQELRSQIQFSLDEHWCPSLAEHGVTRLQRRQLRTATAVPDMDSSDH